MGQMAQPEILASRCSLTSLPGDFEVLLRVIVLLDVASRSMIVTRPANARFEA